MVLHSRSLVLGGFEVGSVSTDSIGCWVVLVSGTGLSSSRTVISISPMIPILCHCVLSVQSLW